MGDEFLKEMADEGKWNSQEIADYTQNAKKELISFYLNENLPKSKPWDRARYLDRKIPINDEGSMETQLLKILKRNGRAQTLIKLENFIIDSF